MEVCPFHGTSKLVPFRSWSPHAEPTCPWALCLSTNPIMMPMERGDPLLRKRDGSHGMLSMPWVR